MAILTMCSADPSYCGCLLSTSRAGHVRWPGRQAVTEMSTLRLASNTVFI